MCFIQGEGVEVEVQDGINGSRDGLDRTSQSTSATI
jgi:hypothetical protein